MNQKDKIRITIENGTKINYTGDFEKLSDNLSKTRMDGWLCIADKMLIPKKKILLIEKVMPND